MGDRFSFLHCKLGAGLFNSLPPELKHGENHSSNSYKKTQNLFSSNESRSRACK